MTSDKGKDATDLFAQGFNCSQAVFSVFAEEHGLDPVLARKIGTSFGAGIGRTGNICGAVSGAILAIGCIHGMNDMNDSAAKEKCYSLDQQFIHEFIARYGSVQCPDLLGYHLGVQAEWDEAKKQGVVAKICPNLVKGAVLILDEILEKDRS